MAMGSSGVDQDWITGEPLEPMAQSLIRQRAQQQRLLNQQDRMNILAQSIASPTGDALMKLVTDKLASRIIAMCEHDDECKAYLGVLRTLGYELDIGRQASQALVAASVGQAP